MNRLLGPLHCMGFARHNSQEDVFADCRGLIGSAVDGFNVTVCGPQAVRNVSEWMGAMRESFV